MKKVSLRALQPRIGYFRDYPQARNTFDTIVVPDSLSLVSKLNWANMSVSYHYI